MASASRARAPVAVMSSLLTLLLLAGAVLGERRLGEPLTVPPAVADQVAADAPPPNDRISSSDACLTAQSYPACLSSPDFRFSLCLQPTGNVTLTYTNRAVGRSKVYWQGGAAVLSDRQPLQFCVAPDGSVAIRDRLGETAWSAGSGSAVRAADADGPMVGYVQDDGAFAVYDAACRLVWSTGKHPRSRAVSSPCSSSGGSATPSQNGNGWRKRYLNWVNAARREVGAPPLVLSDRLNAAAQRQANSMYTSQQLTHDDAAAGLSYYRRLQRDLPDYLLCGIGENICGGEDTPAEAHNAFMTSPGHRANVLTADYKAFGVGFVNGWWSEIFAGCVTPTRANG